MTHLHYDHILGLLNWFVFPPEARVRVYAGVPQFSRDYDPTDFLKPPFWPVSPTNMEDVICIGCDSRLHLTERTSARFSPANHPDNATIIRVDTDSGSMALVCDWEHTERPVPKEMTNNCSFIIYDGMFTDTEYLACMGWGHSTWREGVKLVKERGIPRLVITHHLPERTDAQLREMEREAQQEFPGIRFARAMDCYSLQMLGEAANEEVRD